MGYDISIILPSYNKFPLNKLTLYSLEMQQIDLSKMEVILLDDASTDDTPNFFMRYKPPFPFRYIRLEKNVGRAKTRNQGIQQAQGEVLLFMDAEMIVDPKFVMRHLRRQREKERLVFSGIPFSKKVYTCFFPEFTKEQIREAKMLAKQDQYFYMAYKKFKSINRAEKVQLLHKRDISLKKYRNLVKSHNDYAFKGLTDAERYEGFDLPWINFLCGGVSIRKDLIIEAEAFDEAFTGYGFEDWELGYRLYKLGVTFEASHKVKAYHQEHPIFPGTKNQNMKNLHRFATKHQDMDVLLFGLIYSGLSSFPGINNILKQYKECLQTNPEFNFALQALKEMLNAIIILLKIDLGIINIPGAAGLSGSELSLVRDQINLMRTNGRYDQLAATIDLLISL